MVLVHGAFADASSWDGVVARLQRRGYPVIAPANPLRSVSGDAACIASVVRNVRGDVILVGHSYGGSVITNAARQASNVKALVYPVWKKIPSWAIITTQDKAIDPNGQRWMAKRATAHVVEVKSSHAVSVNHPGAVADAIFDADLGTR
ncbi:alpha/beta fold hydrolase [Nonomuraea sp. NPDC050786]|uniref:alpha/beta fold hydrolase n=1 Tax=Nonomuraea sp. NPDC050786 TaxID=3154840 RepID=UPI0033CC0A3C